MVGTPGDKRRIHEIVARLRSCGLSPHVSKFQSKINAELASGTVHHAARLNARLERVERQLLTRHGLPGRHWYQHQIYAPGINQGHARRNCPACTMRCSCSTTRRGHGRTRSGCTAACGT